MGLYTITALAEKESVQNLDIEDLQRVFDKYDISATNKSLKSFTMVFGTNGPLFQNSFKPHNKELYRDFLQTLLHEMKNDYGNHTCEICGRRHGFDIDDIWGKVINKYGLKQKERKYLGRDFFPLAGSLGNDAQALPGASRTLDICPLCLFAVNYIPLGTMLIKGRLICIESTYEEIVLELVKDIVTENNNRISAGDSQIYGKKEGQCEIFNRLLRMFNNLQRKKKLNNLPDTTALYLWLFSNSGTGADCDVIEIPNRALKFLWKVSRQSQEFINEFKKLISNDKHGVLFESINYGYDYDGLYPYAKKYPGVSVELYEYYQQYVVGRSRKALDFAKRVAVEIIGGKDKAETQKWQKSDIFKDASNRDAARKAMVDLALKGETSVDDYLELFGDEGKYLKTREYDGYRVIMYYLYNFKTPGKQEDDNLELQVRSQKTDPKIKKFAELYFKYYVYDKEKGVCRGIERFKKDILDKFKSFKEGWLEDSFANMAKVYECKELDFTYDGWLEFITDSDGNRRIYELLFQLRLAFANLYHDFLKEVKTNE